LKSSNPRFAVGAVTGSSIVVCTVALGTCLWIGASARHTGHIILQPAVKRQCVILGGSLLITSAIACTGFTVLLGSVAVLYYIWFLIYSLQRKATPEEQKQQDDLEEGEIEEEESENVSVRKGVLYLVTGGLLIVIFSSPFINAVVKTASLLKVNPILLAFFLAPIASEAPEILESISLSRKGKAQSINIAYSNLIGGTITKTTLLCGIFCYFGVVKEFKWESPSYSLSLSLLIICAGSAAGIGAAFQKQSKWHGLALWILFLTAGIVQYTTNSHIEDTFPDDQWHTSQSMISTTN